MLPFIQNIDIAVWNNLERSSQYMYGMKNSDYRTL
jgi:hypothetical protein